MRLFIAPFSRIVHAEVPFSCQVHGLLCEEFNCGITHWINVVLSRYSQLFLSKFVNDVSK
jgi:hypothetical protein